MNYNKNYIKGYLSKMEINHTNTGTSNDISTKQKDNME